MNDKIYVFDNMKVFDELVNYIVDNDIPFDDIDYQFIFNYLNDNYELEDNQLKEVASLFLPKIRNVLNYKLTLKNIICGLGGYVYELNDDNLHNINEIGEGIDNLSLQDISSIMKLTSKKWGKKAKDMFIDFSQYIVSISEFRRENKE